MKAPKRKPRQEPSVSAELASLILAVNAELRRLVATGFPERAEMLYERRDDFPSIAGSHLGVGLCALRWHVETAAQKVREVVDYLELGEAAGADAWLRRQLDGLGEKGGA